MARIDELDRAGKLETSMLLEVAAEMIRRGNALPPGMSSLAWASLLGVAKKMRLKKRGRRPSDDTARERGLAIDAILQGERPAAAIKAALGDRYDDTETAIANMPPNRAIAPTAITA